MSGTRMCLGVHGSAKIVRPVTYQIPLMGHRARARRVPGCSDVEPVDEVSSPRDMTNSAEYLAVDLVLSVDHADVPGGLENHDSHVGQAGNVRLA